MLLDSHLMIICYISCSLQHPHKYLFCIHQKVMTWISSFVMGRSVSSTYREHPEWSQKSCQVTANLTCIFKIVVYMHFVSLDFYKIFYGVKEVSSHDRKYQPERGKLRTFMHPPPCPLNNYLASFTVTSVQVPISSTIQKVGEWSKHRTPPLL